MDIEREDLMHVFKDPAVPLPATQVYTDVRRQNNNSSILQDTINKHVDKVREQMECHLEWAVLEIAHWRQRCEELEIELFSIDSY